MKRPPANRSDFKHHPFWCEENIWHLAQHAAAAAEERYVIVLTGSERQVACWEQKAGEVGDPILWDYHVVLATRNETWLMWDLDTRLPLPVAARTWLLETFPFPQFVPRAFQPRFALYPADTFVASFGSDRGHMHDGRGGWTQPPPPWPPIAGTGLRLRDALVQARGGLTLEELRARLDG